MGSSIDVVGTSATNATPPGSIEKDLPLRNARRPRSRMARSNPSAFKPTQSRRAFGGLAEGAKREVQQQIGRPRRA